MAQMTRPGVAIWRPGWFAEKHLFEALQAGLGDDWHVFHDYACLGRNRPTEGAIDFIVVHREHGMLAIEFKGLESDVVILVDVRADDLFCGPAFLYTAAARARVLPHVFETR